MTVRTGTGTGVAGAVALLAGTGITAADLSSASGDAGGVQWVFQLTVPFSKMKGTGATLARARHQLDPGAMSYAVGWAQVSEAAQAAACDFAALVSDARREADRVASAAGVRAGEIVGLLEGAYGSVLGVPANRSGSFSGVVVPNPFPAIPVYNGVSYASFLLGSVSAPAPAPCGMTVVFRLL